MGEENHLGSFLVADCFGHNSVGPVFARLVVGVFAVDADVSVESYLYLVAGLGF
jgi:hypothetical protein